MNVVRGERKADLIADVGAVSRLDHPLEAVNIDDNLIVYALKRDAGDDAVDVCGGGAGGHDVDILRADDDVDRGHFAKAAVERLEALTGDLDEVVFDHGAVKDIAFADEVRNEGVFRFVVDVNRRADLLNFALIHDNDRVTHGERFLLVVRDENERDADGLLDFFEFVLHILAQL